MAQLAVAHAGHRSAPAALYRMGAQVQLSVAMLQPLQATRPSWLSMCTPLPHSAHVPFDTISVIFVI
jgi:hypothetical protein